MYKSSENNFQSTMVDMNYMNYPNTLTPPLDSPDSMMLSPSSGSNTPPYAPVQEIVLSHGFSSNNMIDSPHLVITEQPVERFRFRYRSEMAGTHGSLNGQRSDRSRKQTYPCVKLINYNKPALIRCSLFQWSRPEMMHTRQPHAHRLVKRHGSEEMDDPHDISINAEEGYYANFHSMGIIHTAKKFIVPELTKKNLKLKQEEVARKEGKVRQLTKKEELEVKSIAEKESKCINLNIVCLRFDAFSKDNGILYPICPPVYSHAINNLKSALTGDLKIVRMDHCTSPSRGGREIFILVEKVTKKNVKIRFFELDDEDNETWSDYGRFTELDVHHQYAIVFKTPPYKNVDIDKEVRVFIELQRPTDGARSEAKDFSYTPCEIAQGRKRARCNYDSSSSYFSSNELPTTISQVVNVNTNLENYNLVVNSGELDEALKQNNINSDEFKNICDQLLGSGIQQLYATQEFRMGSAEMQSLLQNDSPISDTKRETFIKISSNGILSNDQSLAVRESIRKNSTLGEEDIRLIDLIYRELSSFLLACQQPSKARICSVLENLFFAPKYLSENGNTVLHLVILQNDPRILIFLLRLLMQYQFSQFVNIQNRQGKTPLHFAVETNNYFVVEHLMHTKADLSLQDLEGNTPLHLAIIKHCPVIILKLLLSFNEDTSKFIDLENYDGLAPLHLAIKTNNIPATKLLCWNKANVNIEHKKNGYTALHMAVADHHLSIVKFLLNTADVKVDTEDYRQCSPIELARVLIEPDKPVTQHIFDVLKNYMMELGIPCAVTIKEEIETMSEEEIEDIKIEPHTIVITTTSFNQHTEECLNKACDLLDASESWKKLSEVLNYEHLTNTSLFTAMRTPSRSLINFALTNGDSLQKIRDCLERIQEEKAVEILDSVIKTERSSD